jgi:hypothetical protein
MPGRRPRKVDHTGISSAIDVAVVMAFLLIMRMAMSGWWRILVLAALWQRQSLDRIRET